jgi:hypothetical protein
MDAALMIYRMAGNAVLSKANPYRCSNKQFGGITFGTKSILSLLAQASLLAQKASYYYKWQLHRRARPEVFGARIDRHKSGVKSYDIDPAVLESETTARIRKLHALATATGLSGGVSDPSRIPCIAGACATILKAFFDEQFVIPDPVQAAPDGLQLKS